jgi:hypothetical protein
VRIKLWVIMAVIAAVAMALGAARALFRPRGIVYPAPSCTVKAHLAAPGVIAIEATATLANPSRDSAVFWFQASVRRLQGDRAAEVWFHSWDEPVRRAHLARGSIAVLALHGGEGIPLSLPRGSYLATVLVREEDGPGSGPAMVVCGDSARIEIPGP